MFNFRLYNGSITIRLFVALTVALCIWSIISLTADAREMEATVPHVHEGDPLLGTGCYARPIYHEHTGSKKSGGGCYGKTVEHIHSGDSTSGGGCYGECLFHKHSGSSESGTGCYGKAIYHSHTGSAFAGGGCFGKAIYHTHEGGTTSGGACYATPIYHQHEGVEGTNSPNGCYTKAINVNVGKVCGTFVDIGNAQWKCTNCGWTIPEWNLPVDRQHWPQIMETRYYLGCEKTQDTIEGYALSCGLDEDTIEGYETNCGKTTEIVEGYQLSCGKSETSIDGYALNCGMQEGQIEGYKRNCGMTTKTIVGYELSCGMEEGAPEEVPEEKLEEVLEELVNENGQPVKVPLITNQSDEIEILKTEMITTNNTIEDQTTIQTIVEEESRLTDDKEEKLQLGTFSVLGKKQFGLTSIFVLILFLVIRMYISKTVALFYYDEQGNYHSLGRIGFKQNQKGYHIEIGNHIRRKATTDRYRIRTSKQMQKMAEKQHLYVRIQTQVMKLGLEEYVDFAL